MVQVIYNSTNIAKKKVGMGPTTKYTKKTLYYKLGSQCERMKVHGEKKTKNFSYF